MEPRKFFTVWNTEGDNDFWYDCFAPSREESITAFIKIYGGTWQDAGKSGFVCDEVLVTVK